VELHSRNCFPRKGLFDCLAVLLAGKHPEVTEPSQPLDEIPGHEVPTPRERMPGIAQTGVGGDQHAVVHFHVRSHGSRPPLVCCEMKGFIPAGVAVKPYEAELLQQ